MFTAAGIFSLSSQQKGRIHQNNAERSKYPQNNTERSKFVVISHSIAKYLKPNDLVSRENFVKVPFQSGATTEDMLDYIKSLVRKKPDTIMIHTGTNDVTNVVKTVNNVKKVAQYIREDDGDQKIQIGLSSIC